MKVLIANNSGNVGKSFIARELFYSNFEKEKAIIEVETHNSSSSKYKNINSIKVDGENMKDMFDAMFRYDDFVLDIGASQIITFFSEISKINGIGDDIDLVIIPVTADNKIQQDSLKTLQVMTKMGLKDKTRVIFNRVDSPKEITDFLALAKKEGYNLDHNLRILNYDAINEIDRLNITATELASSTKDYKSLARAATTEEDRQGNIAAYTLQRYAVGIKKNLDDVYSFLLSSSTPKKK